MSSRKRVDKLCFFLISLMLTAEKINFPKKIITMLLIFYMNHSEKNKAMNGKVGIDEDEEKEDEINE